MLTAHTTTIEIESLAHWNSHLAKRKKLSNCVVQSLDLREHEIELHGLEVAGALFLGCQLSEASEDWLRDHGALIFPTLPQVPFNAYHAKLYKPSDLYDAIFAGGHYSDTCDAKIYSWLKTLHHPTHLPAKLAMSLHDFSIADALVEKLAAKPNAQIVGVMGGHAVDRGSDGYIGAARLGSRLALQGYTVLTGGGPGAMEATNLGAYLAGDYAALVEVVGQLANSPSYHGDPTGWIGAALDVVESRPARADTVSVPTWFYGHEPSNVFAGQIAKFFSNAIREDILLEHCRSGIIYLPGKAGTVQEVFQAATNNYYAQDPVDVRPMIFVDADYWTNELPLWQLVEKLGNGRLMGEKMALVKDVDEAADWLAAHHQS